MAPPPARERPSRLRRALRLAGLAGLAIAIGASAVIAVARWHWLGDIASNFRWQLGWGTLAAAGLLLAAARPCLALGAVLLAAWHLSPAARLWIPGDRGVPAPVRTEIRVAFANLLVGNHRGLELGEWLEREQPDVLGLAEVNAFWRAAIEFGAQRWPHRVLWPEDGSIVAETTFGTALLSRYPIESARVTALPQGNGLIDADLRVGEELVHVVVAHPVRPGRDWAFVRRRAQFAAIAERPRWGASSILLADLNASASSPFFCDLLERSGLADSRPGFGRQPTWSTRGQRRVPSWLPPLWVDVDHVLIGSRLRVLDRRTAPIPGSDHRAVIARLVLGASESRKDGQAAGY